MQTPEPVLKAFGQAIQKLIRKTNLGTDETYALFREILNNQQPDMQQGAFLAALVSKGETAEEIVGAWRAIQELDTVPAPDPLPDLRCDNSGTGMDTLKTFNVSSAAAIVAAACGVTMTRHGARALTSFCGTVDILEAVGVDVECDVAITTQSVRQVGIGLYNGMSASVHPAALGRILSTIRFGSTLNIAASLANPARPTHAVRGVYSLELVPLLAAVMPGIGYQRGMVVHGQDYREPGGMDELSVTGPTLIQEFTASGTTEAYVIHPEELGLASSAFGAVAATGDKTAERQRFLRVLAGRDDGACADFTHLNAAAILYITGKAGSIKEGIARSREAITRGAALQKLLAWVAMHATGHTSGEAILKRALADAGLAAGQAH